MRGLDEWITSQKAWDRYWGGPEDELDPSVNGDIDSMEGEDEDVETVFGFDDEDEIDFEPEDDDEEDEE